MQEAIKESTPADMNEDDDAEIEEAEEEGGIKEAAVKAKHKTKSHILGLFRSGGKKAAGARGDVSVDGKGKRVGSRLLWIKPSTCIVLKLAARDQ